MDTKIIPCIGATCQRRAQCLCYAALDHSEPNSLRIYMCTKDANGVGIRFVPMAAKPEIHQERRAA